MGGIKIPVLLLTVECVGALARPGLDGRGAGSCWLGFFFFAHLRNVIPNPDNLLVGY